jgi:hypothetical protein
MRRISLRASHVNEHRLAEAAEGGAQARLTDAEQRHVAACERCGRLFEGHRLTMHLLSGPWQRVDTRRPTLLMWRRDKVARWAGLAATVAIAVALTAALLYWRQSSTPAISASASPTSASTFPTAPLASSSPLPTLTPLFPKDTQFPNSTPSSATTVLDIPAALRTNVPLPASAQVDTTRLVADSDWLVMGITFPDAPMTEALYAANLHTGALRQIRAPSDSVPEHISVAGSQAAWADETCQISMPSPLPTEQAHIPPLLNCSSWRVILTDLDTGASRVVAQGSNPSIVNGFLSGAGDAPVPAVPAVALGDGGLAYTTGDLTHGLKLNLLTLSSGSTRTLPLPAPIEEMKWAGQELAWVEDSDLQPAGSLGGSPYPWYWGSHLMLLSQGASAARRIADGAYFLDADTGEIFWDIGGCVGWTASAPGWLPVDTHYDYACSLFVSDGWLGWTVDYPNANFLVLGPTDSEPVGIPDGVALTGGWLVLGSQPAYPPGSVLIPTKLEVVPVSELK